jgi:hypothetical protein
MLNACALKPEPAAGPNGWAEAARSWRSQASAAMPSLFASQELLFASLHIEEIAMFWTSL